MSKQKLSLIGMCTLALLLVPSVAFGNATILNGVCIQGNCAMVDVLLPGTGTAGSFSAGITFGNGDAFIVDGSYNNSESSDGLSISIAPYLTVTFAGNTQNNNGPSVAPEFLDIMFMQGYQVNFTNGVFGAGLFGFTTGGFGAGSTLEFLANINGTGLQSSPVFTLPGNFQFFDGNNQVNNIVNPLILTFEYQLTFGTGTQPGATVFIDQNVPEPSSLMLLGTGFIGALAGLWRKLI